MSEMLDVVVVGGGHNGLVAAALLAQRGLSVRVLEREARVGGAARTERPFARAPGLRASTGAYLLGLMPPELLRQLEIELPLRRRDPHYFLPMSNGDYLLLGSDDETNENQLARLFGPSDVAAHRALQQELSELRDDLADTWLQAPLSIEETAERYVRPERRRSFVALCRGSVGAYLERFGFRSELLKAMYAVTDGFVGTCGGWDSPGTGMNFLLHNMGRLPGSDGTWMVVEGGMGTVSACLERAAQRGGAQVETRADVVTIDADGAGRHRVHLQDGREVRARSVVMATDPFRMRQLLGPERLPAEYNDRLDGYALPGMTLKVNLALRELPRFACLPEDRGQHATTAHLFFDDVPILESLREAFAQARRGELPERPSLEWLCHSPLDPALRDAEGRHSAALFVQWVPYAPQGGWARHEARYVQHLLSLVDHFAPGLSDAVEDVFVLHPQRIESHFGMTRGHIHHIDNRWGFADRLPYATPVPGVYAASAGCHPGGSVIGAAGHNAAVALLRDLELSA